MAARGDVLVRTLHERNPPPPPSATRTRARRARTRARRALQAAGGSAQAAPSCSSTALHKLVCRRELLLACALLEHVGFVPRAFASDSAPLWERLERRELPKPLFSSRPEVQRFPDWLVGDWDAAVTFSGFAFPSRTVDKSIVIADTTLPGFTKLSIAFIPDVGSDVRHALRFVTDRSGGVVEDRAFNLTSVINASLRGDVVEDVEFDAARDPNRATIAFKRGATNNAERIELFANARESATRPGDGVFFAAESTRQVTLGYSTSFNAPRVAVTDYQIVRTFRLLPDGSVRSTQSTAAYAQPNEALRYTSKAGQPPELSGLLGATTQPLVLYSHVVAMTRPPAQVA